MTRQLQQGDGDMLGEDYPILLSIQQAARKVGKSEKTIRRWIAAGKLKADNRGAGGYLIKREDLAALTPHVTKEWQEQSDLAAIRLQVSIMESQIEYLRALADAQQGEIEELQRQVKKLLPKAQKPATRKKTTTRTARRTRDEEFW
jgi:excisionase family DNA binding protein